MKRELWRAIAGALSFLLASAAIADISEEDIRQFEKGKTTYTQVVEKLGPPTRTEFSDEGLRGIAYLDRSTNANAASTVSVLGSLAAIFIPGGAGLATSAASLATGTLAGGAEGKHAITAFAFDKNGTLLYYRANVITASVGAFSSSTNKKTITSEDGAAPLFPINMPLSDEQRMEMTKKFPADDKPRLGIVFSTFDKFDERIQARLAATKFLGVYVAFISDGLPAHKAGLMEGDYLYLANGMLVTSQEDMAQAMSTVRKGDAIKLHVRRINRNANLWKEKVLTVQF